MSCARRASKSGPTGRSTAIAARPASTISREDFSKRIVADADFAAQWGDLGPVYGKQWVDWPVYEEAGDGLFRRGQGINQVQQVVDSLRSNPGSRRHIIEGWNVAELDAMALPPCHKSYQFHVADGKLSGLLYQRSCDLGLGFAFNIWSLALLTRMLAQQTGYEPGEAVWMGADVHLYLNHEALVEEQLSRTPGGEARLEIVRQPASMFDYRIEDFAVSRLRAAGAYSCAGGGLTHNPAVGDLAASARRDPLGDAPTNMGHVFGAGEPVADL